MRKGLAPASGGGTTNFLRADGVFAAPPGAGGGEANTASNAGTAGVGVFKQKTGLDLEFKKINASTANVTITDDVANSELDIGVNGYATMTDGTTAANAVGGDTFKLRAGAGLTVVTQNNDATHGDNALFSLEPRLEPLLANDFLTTTTAQGLHPFSAVAISTGTISTSPAAGVVDGNHPGVILLRSSTTANSGFYVMTGMGTAADRMRIAGGEQFDLIFRTPAALTALTYRFGFHDTITSADAVDGLYFEMPATGAIVGKTSNNSTRTTSATIATLAVNTWYHARIVVNANATGVDFFVYDMAGTQLGTVNITTNIPTASGRELGCGGVFTNSGTTAADIVMLDYMAFGMPGRILQRGALT